ncbi:MAG TPA: signal peptidase I [Mycobacteriales bacterium]
MAGGSDPSPRMYEIEIAPYHPYDPRDAWRPAAEAQVHPLAEADQRAGYAGDVDGAGRSTSGRTPPEAVRPRPSRAAARRRQRRIARMELPLLVVFSLLTAIVVRTLVLQTFFIPSGSMHPTLLEDDRVIVNKLSYHLHDVSRGDVVVFRRPPRLHINDEDLIKRVIGLPGDTVTAHDRKVFVNGRALQEPYVPSDCRGTDDFLRVTVPSDRVFVMGDNRCNSTDSRVFGPISEHLLVGRAFCRIWPVDRLGWL